MTNRCFWKVIKPFLTKNRCLTNSDIMLIGNDQMITDGKKLVNIVERFSGIKPEKLDFSV